MPITKKELIEQLNGVADDAVVRIVNASTGHREHKNSATFALLAFDPKHCVLVSSNYVKSVIPAIYPDEDTRS